MDTTFVNNSTVIVADWLNEINDHVWHDTPVSGLTVHQASNISNAPAGTLLSTTVQDALNELDVEKASVDSPTFTGTVSGITKSMVGLSNVDNTSDVNKPVSTATQTALNGKADLTGAVFSGSFGYGVGAGGTVTQATSKSTAVTLNKPFGVITMHNASLAAGETVQFNLNNSLAGANDIVYSALCGGAANGSYYRVQAQVYTSTPGIVFIQLTNQSAIPLAEAVQIKFILFKGATS